MRLNRVAKHGLRAPRLGVPVGMLRRSQRALSMHVMPSPIMKVFVRINKPDVAQPWQLVRAQSATGSGFIISAQRRLILTNAHVVENASFIELRREGDPDLHVARLLFLSLPADLALLTVDDDYFWHDATDVGPLHSVPLLHEKVFVMGYPIGGDGLSITSGVVSRISLVNYVKGYLDRPLMAAQIDAAINPGNSGGPVMAIETPAAPPSEAQGGGVISSPAGFVGGGGQDAALQRAGGRGATIAPRALTPPLPHLPSCPVSDIVTGSSPLAECWSIAVASGAGHTGGGAANGSLHGTSSITSPSSRPSAAVVSDALLSSVSASASSLLETQRSVAAASWKDRCAASKGLRDDTSPLLSPSMYRPTAHLAGWDGGATYDTNDCVRPSSSTSSAPPSHSRDTGAATADSSDAEALERSTAAKKRISGRWVGVAFQEQVDASNIGYIIPRPIIAAFVRAYAASLMPPVKSRGGVSGGKGQESGGSGAVGAAAGAEPALVSAGGGGGRETEGSGGRTATASFLSSWATRQGSLGSAGSASPNHPPSYHSGFGGLDITTQGTANVSLRKALGLPPTRAAGGAVSGGGGGHSSVLGGAVDTNVLNAFVGTGKGAGKSTAPVCVSSASKCPNLSRSMAGGVVVVRVGVSMQSYLQVGDVVLQIAGHDIASDGTFAWRGTERLPYTFLDSAADIGEEVEILVMRGGSIVSTRVPVALHRPLVPVGPASKPPYVVYGGCVFVPLSLQYLQSWGFGWPHEAPMSLVKVAAFSRREAEDEEVVILCQILSHSVTAGYTRTNERVKSVNGEKVRNLKHLHQLLHSSTNESAFNTIVFADESRIVLAKDAAKAADADVSTAFSIPSLAHLSPPQ